MTGIQVSPSTICRILHRYGLTRKRVQQIALQRSDEFRADFKVEIGFFNIDQLVWLDETRRDCARKMGYAMRGERPVCSRVLSRGRRVSALAAMCSEGIIATELYEGTCDGDRFLNFIIGILIPVMLQFDGSSPRSVLIMDNCTVHHVAPVLQTLIDAGIIPMFLPPYSPEQKSYLAILNTT